MYILGMSKRHSNDTSTFVRMCIPLTSRARLEGNAIRPRLHTHPHSARACTSEMLKKQWQKQKKIKNSLIVLASLILTGVIVGITLVYACFRLANNLFARCVLQAVKTQMPCTQHVQLCRVKFAHRPHSC